MSSSSVGLIGAGLLGQSIAHCLLQSNETVTGFDIDQQRCLELVDQGAQTVQSAADVCQQCRRIFLSLPDSTIVATVVEEIRSQLQAGDIIITPRLAIRVTHVTSANHLPRTESLTWTPPLLGRVCRFDLARY